MWTIGYFVIIVMGGFIGFFIIPLISAVLRTSPTYVGCVFTAFSIALFTITLICYCKKKAVFFYPGIFIPVSLCLALLSTYFGCFKFGPAEYNSYGFLDRGSVLYDKLGREVFYFPSHGRLYYSKDDSGKSLILLSAFKAEEEDNGDTLVITITCKLHNAKGEELDTINEKYIGYKKGIDEYFVERANENFSKYNMLEFALGDCLQIMSDSYGITFSRY